MTKFQYEQEIACLKSELDGMRRGMERQRSHATRAKLALRAIGKCTTLEDAQTIAARELAALGGIKVLAGE